SFRSNPASSLPLAPRPYQSLTGRPCCTNALSCRFSYVPVWHGALAPAAQPNGGVRISLKPGALESLSEWMFAAPETAVPPWAPPQHLRSTADYARISASGVYPALQGNADVASQAPKNENAVTTVANIKDRSATGPAAGEP